MPFSVNVAEFELEFNWKRSALGFEVADLGQENAATLAVPGSRELKRPGEQLGLGRPPDDARDFRRRWGGRLVIARANSFFMEIIQRGFVIRRSRGVGFPVSSHRAIKFNVSAQGGKRPGRTKAACSVENRFDLAAALSSVGEGISLLDIGHGDASPET